MKTDLISRVASARASLDLATAAGVLAASCCLTACGGGDSHSDTATVTPVAASQPGGSVSSPAPVPTPFAGSTCNIPDFAATLLARVNRLRAAGADCRGEGKFAPAPAFTMNALLTQAAEAHSQDMVAKNFFSHVGSNGSKLGVRVDATGYAWSAIGENIAGEYSGIDAVLTGWMSSDGHCANIMNPQFQEMGMVCVPGKTGSTYTNYWTMDLARPL